MRKTICRMAVCGIFLAAAVSIPANAQFYLGIRGGMSNQDAKAGEIEFDQNSAFLYGAQAGIKFLFLAVEGQFYRADHDLMGENIEQQMNYYYLGVNGKLGIPLPVVYPYITVGYGSYSVDLGGLGKDTDTAFNVGGGVELTFGKIGIFGELRYSDFSVEFESLTWDLGGLDLHLGLNIHF